MKKIFVLGIVLSVVLTACKKDDPVVTERGGIVLTKEIGTYSPDDIESELAKKGLEVPFQLEYSVKAVKIEYMTPDPDGKLVNATGAVLCPVTEGSFPVISFQHGTQTYRYFVPSQGPGNSEASLTGSVAASMGYVVVAADYLGLGDSYIVPPYIHAATCATTVIDMLRAAGTYLGNQGISTDGSLYLTGYSQGATVSMAAHHALESGYTDEFNVTASALMAGAYDLVLTVDTILSRETYIKPVLMAYMINAYDHYYDWNRLIEIFKQPYGNAVPGYFDGTQILDAINSKLPQTISDLMQAKFLQDYRAGNESGVTQVLAENSLLNYTPAAPVLLMHGGADLTVPIQNSLAAEAYYKSNGKTNVEFIELEGLNHEDAAAPAIIGAMQWFETLRDK